MFGWWCKKWKEKTLSKKIVNANDAFDLSVTIIEKKNDYFLIEFEWNINISFAEVLHAAGIIPLPPYLNRKAESSDTATYQTIYAKHDGSVAAPTAGLHFTEAVFQSLQQKIFPVIILHFMWVPALLNLLKQKNWKIMKCIVSLLMLVFLLYSNYQQQLKPNKNSMCGHHQYQNS